MKEIKVKVGDRGERGATVVVVEGAGCCRACTCPFFAAAVAPVASALVVAFAPAASADALKSKCPTSGITKDILIIQLF
ncbi:MAG: hypothetical protein IPN40_17200, partial [Uliginosibacterium sp.]|nr:hypothetical protein [Uliginosibacterium sp.]